MNYLLIPLVAGMVGMMATLPLPAAEKKVVGWIEQVRLHPENIILEAKLDTGAVHCSLDAANLSYFTRNGARWVRFDLDNRKGQKVTLERPIVREATIKRHFLKVQKRPVVRLGVCLGTFYRETDVNLVDRSGFEYLMLIGRNFMQGALIVDPGLKHLTEPECRERQQFE